jgi:hypothetical protein
VRRPAGAAPRRLPAALLALLAVLLLAGCARSVTLSQAHQPFCRFQGQTATGQAVLMAQAVPTATKVPCIEVLPSGWIPSDVYIRNGRARFSLDSDRAGTHAVTVILERTCRLEGATRVPSDEPGTRRYELVGNAQPGAGYSGARFYLFPGGCVTYRFDLKGGERAEPIGEVTLMLSFVSRDAIAKAIHDFSRGRVALDPPTTVAR